MRPLQGLIIETIVPAKNPVTHSVIGEESFPTHRYRTACGLGLRAKEVRSVRARQPTCRNCLRRGKRRWRFTRSN